LIMLINNNIHYFFFQAEDGIRDRNVTGVQTCALPISPEAMDLFQMIAQAHDNGMEYLVMEVSSQAYKMKRVYGMTFDVGAFLNRSEERRVGKECSPLFVDDA